MIEQSLDQTLEREPQVISNRFATIYSNWGVTLILIFMVIMGIYSLINIYLLGLIPLVLGVGGLLSITGPILT